MSETTRRGFFGRALGGIVVALGWRKAEPLDWRTYEYKGDAVHVWGWK